MFLRRCLLACLSLAGCSTTETVARPIPPTAPDASIDTSCAPGSPACETGRGQAPLPTQEQYAQATELGAMLAYFKDRTAWHSPLDWSALEASGRENILRGDGSDLAYFTALQRAFIAIPQGHQILYMPNVCGSVVPTASVSQRGVCGRPHPRGIVVTNVRANNVLRLNTGDLITRVGNASGSAALVSLAGRPVCSASQPSTSNREAVTATTFSDLLRAGEEIEIEAANGTKRTMLVPDTPSDVSAKALSCADPFGRKKTPAESALRSDGVGVIRLPGFLDSEVPFPTNPTDAAIDLYRSTFEAKILAAFEKVKSAKAIVWDVRGNPGGLTAVGLDIASGFPGAREDLISYCQARIAKSDPPEFDSFRYANYALTPGGPFAYTGRVAVLIDGLDYSAADYFPLAVKTRTDALLIGAPTAGGFGAASMSKDFGGPPGFTVTVDVNRCSAADDTPLEGKSTEPHIAVEYEPQDLAAGRDTVLERAVSALLE